MLNSEPTGKSAAGQVGDSSSTTTGKDDNSGEEEVDSSRPVELCIYRRGSKCPVTFT